MVLPVETEWFLWINQHHNAFWDTIMYWASEKFFWLPFYAFIIYCLFQNFCKEIWQVLITIALLIASADQIASGLIKNHVKRLRPSHVPNLEPIIHLSKAGAGGLYGFVSSHAANAFALAVSLGFLLDRSYRPLKIVLLLWAFLVSYSRIYNGVHYLSDVLVAGVIGSLLGTIFFLLHRRVFEKTSKLSNPKYKI